MATKVFTVTTGADGNFGAMADSVDQSAASRTDGWTVAKIAAANMSEFDAGTKQASGSFSTATKPASFLTGTTANAFKTPVALSGIFAATTWSFVMAVRATTAASQVGRIRVRVFKSVNANGSGATELTSSTLVGTSTGTITTTGDSASSVSWAPGAITLNNEFLFVVVAWEITTVSSSNSADVVVRVGTQLAGTRFTTPDFAAAQNVAIGRESSASVVRGVTPVALGFPIGRVTGSAYGGAVLADSPKMFLRLDELSGTTADDSSGQSHPGTYTGTPVFGVAGAVAGGTAVTFSGDDSISVPDHADFDFTRTSPFSLEFWMKNTATAHTALVSKFDPSPAYRGWEIMQLADDGTYFGRLRFQLIDNNATSVQWAVDSPAKYNNGAWRHVVATYSGSGTAAGVKIYIDGAPVSATTVLDALPGGSTVTNNRPVTIGDRPGEGWPFVGSLDGVSIYNTELSAARVLAHYNAASVIGTTVRGISVAQALGDFISIGRISYTPTFGALNASAISYGIGQQAANTRIAQSFKCPSAVVLSSLQVFLSKFGAPVDNLTWEIQTDNAGSPSGTVLGSYTAAMTSYGSSAAWTEIAAGTISGLSLAASTTYWLIARRSGVSDGETVYWYKDQTSAYPDGSVLKYNGASWIADSDDLTFIISSPFGTKVRGISLAGAGTAPVTIGKIGVSGTAQPFFDLYNGVGIDVSRTRLGQTFKLPASDKVTRIDLWMQRVGSPADNITVAIQADVAGSASGTDLTSATINASTISTTAGWVSWGVLNADLIAGTTYWIVVRRSGANDGANHILWGLDSNNRYSNGAYYMWNGSSWALATGYDTTFKVIVATPISTVRGITLGGAGTAPVVIGKAGGTQVYSQETIVGGYGVGNLVGNTKIAGSFRPSQSFSITSLQLWMNRAVPTDNLIVEIQSDSGGNPSGTVLGSYTFLASSIPIGQAWDEVAGGTIAGLSLTANTTYWIVLSRSGAISIDAVTWFTKSPGTGGGTFRRYNGTLWSVSDADPTFKFALPISQVVRGVGFYAPSVFTIGKVRSVEANENIYAIGPNSNSSATQEMGTKFTVAVPGVITAILYPRAGQVVTPTPLSIWRYSDGVRVAYVEDPTPTGAWEVRTIPLTTPLDVIAGVTYVVSDSHQGGHWVTYAVVPAQGTHLTNPEGVLGTTGVMPTTTFGRTYHHDVVFHQIQVRGVGVYSSDVRVGPRTSATVVRGISGFVGSGTAPVVIGHKSAGGPTSAFIVTAAADPNSNVKMIMNSTYFPGLTANGLRVRWQPLGSWDYGTYPSGFAWQMTGYHNVWFDSVGGKTTNDFLAWIATNPLGIDYSGTPTWNSRVGSVTLLPGANGTGAMPVVDQFAAGGDGGTAYPTVVRGITPSVPGVVATGRRAAATIVKGISVAAVGTVPISVGRVAAVTTARGISVSGAGVVPVTIGRRISATTVRGTGLALPGSQGPLYDSTPTESGVQTGWTNLPNVAAADSAYASVILPDNASAKPITFNGLGFSLPAGATITNIKVEVLTYAAGSGADWTIRVLDGAGTATSQSQVLQMATTPGGILTFNGLWGKSDWTQADIESASFGVNARISNVFGANTCYLDAVRVTVSYVAVPATPLAIGRKASVTAVKGITLVPGVAPIGVGQRASITAVNGITFAPAPDFVPIGRRPLVTQVRGVGFAIPGSQGPNYDSTPAVFSTGSGSWVNPLNAASADAVYATHAFVLGGSQNGQYLDFNNLGFSLPAGSTIKDIKVEVNCYVNTWDTSQEVRLLGSAGTVVGATKGENLLNDTPATYQYTGLWSRAWTQAEIESPNFGVRFRVTALGEYNSTYFLDFVRVTVGYVYSPLSPLPVGRRGSGTAVKGITLGAVGDAPVVIGKRASITVAKGIAVAGAGVVPVTIGRKASVSAVKGISVAPTGTVPISVGRRAISTTARGITVAGAPVSVPIGKVIGGATYKSTVLADNPLSYWRLGETAGTVAVDEKGVLNGTYTGSVLPTLGAAGLITGDTDKAISQTGQTLQGVFVGNTAPYQLGTLTMEAWINGAPTDGTYRTIMGKQFAYGFFILNNNLTTYVWNGANSVNSGVAVNGARHHVAVVLRDGVANGSQMYVDGVAAGSPFTFAVSDQTTDLMIGRNAGPAQEFSGTLDDAAIYNSALSASQILAHYNAGISGATGGTTVRGISVAPTGVAPISIGRKVAATTVRGVSTVAGGTAPVGTGRVVAATQVRGIGISGAAPQFVPIGKVAAVPATDKFNRANGPLGANWVASQGAMSITGGQIVGPPGPSPLSMRWVGNTYGNDQYSQIAPVTVGTVGDWCGVIVRDRAASPGLYFYLAIYYANLGSPESRLYKRVNGVYTQLGSSVPGALTSTDAFRIDAVGSTISIKINGATVVSVTDTDMPTGDGPGIASDGATIFDNWQGGDPTATGTTVRGISIVPGDAPISIGRRQSSTVARGVTIVPTDVPLPIGRRISVTTVRGITLKVQRTDLNLPAAFSVAATMTFKKIAARAMPASLVISPAILKRTPQRPSATLALTPAMVKVTKSSRGIDAFLSLNPAMAVKQFRRISFASGLTLTPTMQGGKLKYQTLAGGLTLTPTMTKLSGNYKALAATLTLTPTMARFVQAKRVFNLSLSLNPLMVDLVKKNYALGLLLNPAMAKTKKNYTTLSAILSLSPTQTRVRLAPRAMNASLALSATLSKVKMAPRPFPLTLNLAPTQIKTAKMFRQLDGGLNFTPTMAKKRVKNFNVPLLIEPMLFTGKQYVTIKLASTFTFVVEMSARKRSFADILLGASLGTASLLNAKYNDVRLLLASLGSANLTAATEEDDGELVGASLGATTLNSVDR